HRPVGDRLAGAQELSTQTRVKRVLEVNDMHMEETNCTSTISFAASAEDRRRLLKAATRTGTSASAFVRGALRRALDEIVAPRASPQRELARKLAALVESNADALFTPVKRSRRTGAEKPEPESARRE